LKKTILVISPFVTVLSNIAVAQAADLGSQALTNLQTMGTGWLGKAVLIAILGIIAVLIFSREDMQHVMGKFAYIAIVGGVGFGVIVFVTAIFGIIPAAGATLH
jgi:hypothetical protein